jgi:hypothetical protein
LRMPSARILETYSFRGCGWTPAAQIPAGVILGGIKGIYFSIFRD